MRFVKWLIGIVVVVSILLTAVPLVTKWYVVRWLESKGYQAEIKKLGMNFIFGEMTLQGVSIASPQGERFDIFDGSVNFDFWRLKDRRLVIDRVKGDSLKLDVRNSRDGVTVAGFPLDPIFSRFGKGIPLEIRLLQLTNSDVCRSAEQCLRMENVTGSRIKWLTSGESWSIVHNAPFIIEKAFLRDQSGNTTLFYGAELNIGRGAYTAGSADLENLVLRNFQFVENSLGAAAMEAPYQTRMGEAAINSLAWRGGKSPALVVGVVDITSLRQSFYRNADGRIMLPVNLGLASSQQLHLSVKKIELRDGAVSWLDQSVTPPATANASAIGLQLGVIDSSAPDTPTAIKLTGVVGQRGRMMLEGDIYPYSDQRRFALTGFVQELDIANLSGYSRKYLNQIVDQGVVDLSISAVARNGVLEADTRWQLMNLHIEPGRNSGGEMPLELSYDLLKDHNNSVSLTMPVRGEFGSERLRPEYILSRQMRRMMSDMARRRVNPSGAVRIPATSTAPAGKVAFPPLEYEVNGRYPAETDLNRITEIAAMLSEKPHLRMTFCAVSTGGEWAALFNNGQRPTVATELLPEQQEQLLDLARARGKVLRSRLIEAGAAGDQVDLCDPRVDMTQFGLSFISISL